LKRSPVTNDQFTPRSSTWKNGKKKWRCCVGVTVEQAPIQILVPGHPVFQTPNRITADDWGGWVQERGLYFLAEEGDPRYQDLLASEDPWEYNKGVKKGMLVEARYGEGAGSTSALGLFRQLPQACLGVASFANLLSLGRANRAPAE
jgi:hypothetical protein